MLEGQGTLEVEGVSHRLGPNECMVLDTTRVHGLHNTGTVPMRYLVIITR
jgi:mannose-6-phosphate isomerase-like protein (cupin superfamily)